MYLLLLGIEFILPLGYHDDNDVEDHEDSHLGQFLLSLSDEQDQLNLYSTTCTRSMMTSIICFRNLKKKYLFISYR